jgi:hypothetical protein
VKREFMVERQGRWFVLYAGLLDEAHAQGLKGVRTQLIQAPSPENGSVAICYAEVTTDKGVYTGIGDASPDNVARIMMPHIIRMAETRAKARALRDAVNVGVAALEELSEGEEPSEAAESGSRLREAPAKSDELARRTAPTAPTRPAAPASVGAGHAAATGPAPAGANGFSPTAPNGGMATQNQIRAIYSIARDQHQLDEPRTDEKSVAMFGSAPAFLTKKQASDFISFLQAKEA